MRARAIGLAWGGVVPGRILRRRVPGGRARRIPDQQAALAELARVLKPDGRRTQAAGLSFSRRSGTPLGYFARFERP